MTNSKCRIPISASIPVRHSACAIRHSPFLPCSLLLACCLALAAPVHASAPPADASARANAFFDRVFDEAVARSPQTLAQLGIKQATDRWDDLSETHAAEDLALTAQHLAELRRDFAYDALDARTKVSYRMFVRDAERALEGWRWRHHNYPLNQMSGLHSEAPAFLINYVADVADARAYLARLRALGPLFDQLIAHVRAREARGILPPRFVFPLVRASIHELLRGEPFDAAGPPSALWADFTGKVAALPDAATRAELLAAARAALTGVVQPAYARLLAVLADQEKIATDDDGAWKLPDGAEFYAFALRGATTTRLTADEIHALGLREVARIHHAMEAIMARVGFHGALPAFFQFLKEAPQFYYPTTPEGKAAYLARANALIDAMRARLPEFFLTLPRAPLLVKPVEPFREQGAAGAFYEQPSADGTRPGIYFVNTVDMRGVPIFEMETLAHHEAIPGHHLQIALAQELPGLPKFRRYGGNTAYVEGWALYAEYFPKEFGFYADPYMDFGRLYDELLRAVRLVVDTGLHARRWTRAETMEYFRKNTPNPERDIFTETNRYIVWPGQATAYKVGQLKLLELREQARRALGARFDLRAYHDLVLTEGAVPLDLLEENVAAWLARPRP